MYQLDTKITLAKEIVRSLPGSDERRELIHAIEYAAASPSDHAEQRLANAVSEAKRWHF
jgi:hypothetical protein